jgi:hypothetical protein
LITEVQCESLLFLAVSLARDAGTSRARYAESSLIRNFRSAKVANVAIGFRIRPILPEPSDHQFSLHDNTGRGSRWKSSGRRKSRAKDSNYGHLSVRKGLHIEDHEPFKNSLRHYTFQIISIHC